MSVTDELGPWTALNDDHDALFFGGTDDEHIIACTLRDVDGQWLYVINDSGVCEGGFPSREAAQSAAEETIWAAQRRAERKIIFLFV